MRSGSNLLKGNIEMAKTLALHRTGFQQIWQTARMRKLILPLALFLVFLVGMALIQFSTPDMPDNDGFYHIKLARSRYSSGSAI